MNSNNSIEIHAQISIGELIDKITILKIKQVKMKGDQLENVNKELKSLETIIKDYQIDVDKDLFDNLKKINYSLWEIEDSIRLNKKNKSFTWILLS